MKLDETRCRRAARSYVIALVAVGLIDLITTIIWLRTGRAIEANPVMSAMLRAGLVTFVTVKLASLFSYAAMMEYYCKQCAPRARRFSFTALALYITIYGVSFLGINHRLLLGT